jgi:ABC-type dipeptide/oligopeptide/nickel transport system ATPase subunit
MEANRRALAKKNLRKGILIGLNTIVAFVILLPLLYAFSVAFMPSSELFTTEMNLIPKQPTLENFRQALVKVPLVRFVINSFVVAGCITIGQIISCSLSAFSFSFLKFKGKQVLFMIVMATMMIPGEATIISNYLTVSKLGWLDSYPVLIVPYLTSAMGIFLFRQFYMSVYENMAFGLRVHKVDRSEIDRKVRETARLLQIDHLLDRRPSALSGGQKQRVAIGSVLVREPKLLLMDEPLSNLDAKLRSQMRVELAKIHERFSSTIVYVTHDQVEAMTLADRIVVMREGEIQQIASPNEIYNNPINQFVAGFIGSPSMNFLLLFSCASFFFASVFSIFYFQQAFPHKSLNFS